MPYSPPPQYHQQPLVFPFKNRPFIKISICRAGSCHGATPDMLSFDALLDSGADQSFFPPRLLTEMGHIPHKGKSTGSLGIERVEIPCKIHTCTIAMEMLKPFEIKVLFPDPNDAVVKRRAAALNSTTPLLGRAGFFDKFKIIFYERDKIVMLFPLKSLIA